MLFVSSSWGDRVQVTGFSSPIANYRFAHFSCLKKEAESMAKCAATLELLEISKDESVTPLQMISCCERLTEEYWQFCVSLHQSRIRVSHYYSVMQDGQMCIPWDWVGDNSWESEDQENKKTKKHWCFWSWNHCLIQYHVYLYLKEFFKHLHQNSVLKGGHIQRKHCASLWTGLQYFWRISK